MLAACHAQAGAQGSQTSAAAAQSSFSLTSVCSTGFMPWRCYVLQSGSDGCRAEHERQQRVTQELAEDEAILAGRVERLAKQSGSSSLDKLQVKPVMDTS